VFGKKHEYGFAPKPHDDLGGALGYMDFEAAAKLSGARFVVLKKGLARLERAIGQFMLDLHTNEHGYTEVNPPLLVRDDVMFGTGQLPKFADDQFAAISGAHNASTDPSVLLVEAFAAVGDGLSADLDAVGREAFLSSAEGRRKIIEWRDRIVNAETSHRKLWLIPPQRYH